MDAKRVLSELNASVEGLSEEEVLRRLRVYGYNEIAEYKRGLLSMIWSQLNNLLIFILLAATIISLFLGELIDATTIIAVVCLMVVMGFIQEYKAERAIELLKEMLAPRARVLRAGRVREVPAREVVPGDVLILKEGDRVPADARLVESWDLEVDESMLTGESTPVEKDADAVLPPETPLAERRNMVYMGTYVLQGSAKAVVVATGMNTEVGRIAGSLREWERGKTVLEEELDRFAKRIGTVFLAASALIFVLGVVRGSDPLASLLTAAALAVAAVPEGVPAIATIIMALGARRMASKNAIVRRLASIETLGACNVICTDKTGTLTRGEMCVRRIYLADGTEVTVTGEGFRPEGEFYVNGDRIDPLKMPLLRKLLQVAYLYNESSVEVADGTWRATGSLTEAALLVMALKAGVGEGLREVYPRVRILRFDRFRKRKSTIHRCPDGRYVLFTVGAPEILLERCCSRVARGDGDIELTDEIRRSLMERIIDYARHGLRTVGFAYRYLNGDETDDDPEDLERDLTFLGFVGIMDPPREGVREAVEACKRAGIKVVMVTGDHRVTAEAVAREIGLEVSHDSVVEGRDLDRMSDEELARVADRITIYARVTPDHKVRIVRALKNRGYVVAMTGDGVNDAPALKAADIGVAMGIRGTDVAKSAADLVLADDNFATIVEAVKEGRVIFENLKKPIDYLLTCNFGEVMGVAAADFLGMPIPLRPSHILWVNLLTDALPALGLGLEPPEPDIMERRPRGREGRLLTLRVLGVQIGIGAVLAGLILLLFGSYLTRGLEYARTMAFSTFVVAELIRALSSRSENRLLFKLGTSNRVLSLTILASLLVQLAVIYTPLGTFFRCVPLAPGDLAVMMVVAFIPFIVSEVRKLVIKL